MIEQKELKGHIKQLQDDLVTCNKHFQKQKQQMENLVAIVPSKLLTESVGKEKYVVGSNPEQETYIYESPDGGETIYRRGFNDHDTPREQLDKDGNPLSKQLNLF